jgi:hypothetical protein
MSDVRVRTIPNNRIKVRLGADNAIKVVPVMGKPVLRMKNILDVDPNNVNDKYVLMYDAATQTYKHVNPDEVLAASASTETTQPGLPNEIINVLDIDLDNRINLDGGVF